MKKALIFSALAAFATCSLGLDAKSFPRAFKFEPGMWQQKSKAEKNEWHFTKSKGAKALKKIVTEGEIKMESQNGFSYLDMPDGTTWFVELNYEREINQEYEGGYKDYRYTAIKGIVYNHEFKKVGEINTPIELPEGMAKCTSISLGSLVTKKFFNIDENYEIMFTANYCPVNDYGAIPYTYVLSLQDNAPATHIKTIEGYLVNALNTATDEWSEDYYMQFLSSEQPLAGVDQAATFDVYSKTSWGSDGPQKIGTFEVDMTHAPDVTGYEPGPVIMTSKGRDLYVALARYEKPYFANLGVDEPSDFMLTPDNTYQIDLYKKGPWDKEFTLQSTTRIPCESAPDGYVAKAYGLGLFNYTNDVTFDFTDDNSVAYIIGISNIDNQFNAETTYAIFDKDGKAIKNFGDDTEGYLRLSSVPGHSEQYVFVKNDPDVVGGLVYDFVDFPSFEHKATIPCTLIDNAVNQGSALLSMTMDRTPVGSDYQYVFSAAAGFVDGDDTCHEIIYLDDDGELVRVDVINAGQNVNAIRPYVSGSAMSPYLFNTDSNREYMILVQRRDNASATRAHTELCVVNHKGDLLLQYPFDNDDSDILVSLLNTSSNPSVWIQYEDFDTRRYKSEFISLPLNKLAGTGSAEDPYLISTPGDFGQIAKNTNAHYRLTNDIDFEGNLIASISQEFTGSLDGAGHTVRNFVVRDNPMFYSLYSSDETKPCEIKNLTLSHVKVDGASAILAEGGSSCNVKISNVHIYKAEVCDDSKNCFASFINRTGVNTRIESCSVNIDFERTEAEYFGGIAGELGNGGVITACSVNGEVKAGANVGGIAYATNHANTIITDCHVNLDIEAANTIGGIVADAERSLIERNVVEGKINAHTPGFFYSMKDGKVETMNVGGIIGRLMSAITMDGPATPNLPQVAINNVVALASITIPEGNDKLTATTHRIIGRSSVNEDPAYEGEEENPNYDPNDPDSEEWIILWGDPAPTEPSLANNYAVEGLSVVDPSVGEGDKLTEGATIAANKLDREFFERLGFKFEGYSTEEPWHYGYTRLPELYFEQTAGASMVFDPSVISIEKSGKATVELELEKVDFEGITYEQSSETGFAFNPVNVDEDGDVIIEIEVFEAGTYTLTANYGKIKAELTITGTSGIGDITTDGASVISYDGHTVSAEGCAIAIYNVAGMKVAAGNGSVTVVNLAQGIYAATATDNEGNSSTIKIAVK